MEFQWDEAKNRLNRRNHGIDFMDVASMFEHPMVTFLDRRKDYRETRWVGIGWLGDVLAVVVFTEPAEQVIRIISARKASKHEERIYAREIKD